MDAYAQRCTACPCLFLPVLGMAGLIDALAGRSPASTTVRWHKKKGLNQATTSGPRHAAGAQWAHLRLCSSCCVYKYSGTVRCCIKKGWRHASCNGQVPSCLYCPGAVPSGGQVPPARQVRSHTPLQALGKACSTTVLFQCLVTLALHDIRPG